VNPTDNGVTVSGTDQLGQVWDLLFGECGQVEVWHGISKVREAHTRSNAPEGGIRQEFFIVPNDRR